MAGAKDASELNSAVSKAAKVAKLRVVCEVEEAKKVEKAASAAEKFRSELDVLKQRAREIPRTLTDDEIRACGAVKLQMKGKLPEPGKISVAEVEKIDEAVRAANAAENVKEVVKKTRITENLERIEVSVEDSITTKTEAVLVNSCTPVVSGQWRTVNESMSDFSRKYQKQITGREGMVWMQNGVKFDGMKDGVLLDAKGKYAQFIDKNTGEFYDWFSGKESLIAEAKRQILASEGSKIQWYFAEKESLNVVQDLFMDKGIMGIELIFEAPK